MTLPKANAAAKHDIGLPLDEAQAEEVFHFQLVELGRPAPLKAVEGFDDTVACFRRLSATAAIPPTMPYTLKKFISWFLEPTNVCLLLLAPGLILLWTKRRERLGKYLVTAGLILLAIASNGVIARWLTLSLESQQPPLQSAKSLLIQQPQEIRFVSVLSGGSTDTPNLAANNKLNPTTLARLAEGIRLVKELPDAGLVLSGAAEEEGTTTAEIMKDVAVMFGVSPEKIVVLRSPRDTMEEVAAIRDVVGTRPFILVTSAIHMPRAVGLMRHRGMAPIPAPAQFLVRPGSTLKPHALLCGPGALDATSASLHEYIGILWARLRGNL